MNDSPMKICLVAPVPPPYGGISHWTLMVSRYAATQSNIQLRIVDTASRWRAMDDVVVWKRVLGGGFQLLRDFARVFAQLCRHPQVLHLTTSGQLGVIRDIAVMSIARVFRVPVIYHIRFGRVPQLASGTSREWRFLARAMRLAHTVMAIDASTEQAIQRRLPDVKVVRVPNGVDINRLTMAHAGSAVGRTVMFLGWVIPTKGIEELVEAWAELRPHGWRLLIAGPGNTDYQDRLIRAYEPTECEFIAEKSHDEAMMLMSKADVFVLPSYTEGFPNVVLEAMALGKPIIATRVGAIPEMLEGGCGILVEPREVDELKNALNDLLEDPDLRQRLGAQARERAMNCYSLEIVFAKYMSVWCQAAGLG